jgi:hypothetical protein
MIINKTNIKSMLKITSTTYDTQIDNVIPVILDRLSKACNRFFIYTNSEGRLYDDCDMVIDTTTITLNTDIPFQSGDFFRLFQTDYNNGLYQVKTIENGIITIETSKVMRSEIVSHGIITLIDFPDEFIDVITDYVTKQFIRGNKVGLASEKIDDYQVNFKDIDLILDNRSIINNYKYTYLEGFIINDTNIS